MNILTVNTGSSSVRLSSFRYGGDGMSRTGNVMFKPEEGSPENLLRGFLSGLTGKPDIISHRIVHGGTGLTGTCVIDKKVEEEIDSISVLAPLHNPTALRWVRACRGIIGGAVQAAVFDTAFYSRMPEVSSIYALRRDICSDHGIKRYGFHGIAHMAMLKRLRETSPGTGMNGRVISIQLGSGCSITAVSKGFPVDTSMGFSPNEGLVMSTRSGDVDPGVVAYLQRGAGLSVNEAEEMLNRSSGLLGVSGISGDMKTLLDSGDPRAELAIDLYCYRVKKYIGAYFSALGGADAVLFGGGVGENAPEVRRRILKGMQWCGIMIDAYANEKTIGTEGRISSDESMVDVMVVPVDEAAVLADEAVRAAGRQ